MNDLDLEGLLQRARGTAPRIGSKERLRSRVLAAASAGSVVGLAAQAAGASKASALVAAGASGGGGSLLSLLVCVGGGVAAGLLVVGPALTDDPPAARTQAPKGVVAAITAAAPPSARASVGTYAAPSTSTNQAASPLAQQARSAISQPSVPSIARETALLAEAQRALGRNDAAAALRFLDLYQRDFPTGALAEEASAATAMSWCSLGRKVEGLRALAAFRTRYSTSPLLARVVATCSKLGNHDDFELESSNPSTHSSKRSPTTGATGGTTNER